PRPRGAVRTTNLRRPPDVYYSSRRRSNPHLDVGSIRSTATRPRKHPHGLASQLHAGPPNHHFRSATFCGCLVNISPTLADRVVHVAYPAVVITHHGRSHHRCRHRTKQRRGPLGSSFTTHELLLRHSHRLRRDRL